MKWKIDLNRMKKDLFALLYASISDDNEIYVTSFGVFNTEEEARKAQQKHYNAKKGKGKKK